MSWKGFCTYWESQKTLPESELALTVSSNIAPSKHYLLPENVLNHSEVVQDGFVVFVKDAG